MRLDSNHFDHLLQQFGQREAGLFEIELRRLDLGQIKNIIDQIEKIIAGSTEYLDILVLLR